MAIEQSTQVQARGVWHRPNVTNEETNLAGICSVLDKFQHAGINLVFLEVFYHGMTVFKTPTVEYYTGFESFDYGEYPDYLSAFVAEAETRNIEVHAWVEDFYIGVKANRFVKNCPQWLLLNSKGDYRQSEGQEYGGYIFLDPANTEVRTFLVDFYRELLTKFPQIKGLNLDYIRYPVSSSSDDTGFTQTAMEQFAQLQGWELPDNSIDTFIAKLKKTNTRAKFTDFRAGCVTGFVEAVYEMVKKDHPQVLLSTAIFPEPQMSYNQKKQDFVTWLQRGYLDIVTPMAYYDDNNTLKSALKTMMKDCAGTYCYAGLSSTYHNLSNTHVQQQMDVAAEVGADGVVFFGSQSILNNPGYIEYMHGQFGDLPQKDVLPHTNIADLIEAMGLPLVEELRQSGSEAEGKLLQLQDTLLEIQALGEESQWALDEASNRLKLLAKYNLQAYVSPDNLENAGARLEVLQRYVSVYASRAKVKNLLPAEPSVPGSGDEPTPPSSSLPTTQAPSASIQTQVPGKKSSIVPIAAGAAAAILGGAAIIAATVKRKKSNNSGK